MSAGTGTLRINQELHSMESTGNFGTARGSAGVLKGKWMCAPQHSNCVWQQTCMHSMQHPQTLPANRQCTMPVHHCAHPMPAHCSIHATMAQLCQV